MSKINKMKLRNRTKKFGINKKDLLATKTVMEEMWRYHPNNPNKKDITQEYKVS